MSHTADFSRFFLIILNVGFWFLGGAAFGAGFYVKYDKQQMMNFLSRIPYQGESIKAAVTKTSLLDKSAVALMFLGGFIFVIGASGMYGSIRKSRKLLFIYISVVTAVLLLEFVALGTSIYFKSMVKSRLKTFLSKSIATSYKGTGITSDGELDIDADPLSTAWDFAMGYLECCGNTNYTDFMMDAVYWNSTYEITEKGSNETAIVNATVPPICCKMKDHSKFPADISHIEFVDLRGCLEYPREVNANLVPCYDKLYAVFLQYIKIALLIVAAIVLLEVVALVAAIVVVKDVMKDKEKPLVPL